MGMRDMIRGEFVDIIEWLDDTNTTLAWRFPRYENEIKNGAQLIVREGQRADVRLSRSAGRPVHSRSLHPDQREHADLGHAAGMEVRIQQSVPVRGVLTSTPARTPTCVGALRSR